MGEIKSITFSFVDSSVFTFANPDKSAPTAVLAGVEDSLSFPEQTRPNPRSAFRWREIDDGIEILGFADGHRDQEELFIPREIAGRPVARISSYAFERVESLRRVVAPYGVRTVGSSAFSGCMRLQYAWFGEGLKTIEDEAFYACLWLRHVSLPSSLSRIGMSAFERCGSLNPASLRLTGVRVDSRAFRDCRGARSEKKEFAVANFG